MVDARASLPLIILHCLFFRSMLSISCYCNKRFPSSEKFSTAVGTTGCINAQDLSWAIVWWCEPTQCCWCNTTLLVQQFNCSQLVFILLYLIYFVDPISSVPQDSHMFHMFRIRHSICSTKALPCKYSGSLECISVAVIVSAHSLVIWCMVRNTMHLSGPLSDSCCSAGDAT